MLRRSQASLVELAFQNRRNCLIIGSLDPQEVSVAVQSIGTAVQVGNVAGDHLLVPTREMALGKMDGVGEIHHLPQKIRPRTKALDDARHLCPAGARTPVIRSE